MHVHFILKCFHHCLSYHLSFLCEHLCLCLKLRSCCLLWSTFLGTIRHQAISTQMSPSSPTP
jgi:hypothetical protein